MAKAKRKEVLSETPSTGDVMAALKLAASQGPQPAHKAEVIHATPILVSINLEGGQVNVANKPLITGEQMTRAGAALRGLCYNILNGTLSAEIRDTSAECWRGIGNSDKYAFRFLRDLLDGSEALRLPAEEMASIKAMSTPQRAAMIRNKWAQHVASQAAKRDEAKAAGKRATARVREITLVTLKKLFRGVAPKGGGITGLKDGILAELQALKKALSSKNMKAVAQHLNAAIALCEPKEAEEPKAETK